ncbi:MAG: hypothetical protein ABEI78_01865 [Candidatus Nanohaloarchaea archaeon]
MSSVKGNHFGKNKVITEEAAQQIEDEINLNPREIYDEVKPNNLENYEEVAATTSANEDIILETRDGTIKEDILAHETVHGEFLKNEKLGGTGDFEIIGEDPFEEKVYNEFTAYLAQDQVGDIQTTFSEANKYLESHDDLKETIRRIDENSIPDNQELFKHIDESEEYLDWIDEEYLSKFIEHQDDREQILAKYAAEQYSEEKEDISFPQLLDPNKQTYKETINYINDKEVDLFTYSGSQGI